MLRALDEMVITGVPTTAGFHKLILNHPEFRAGNVDTSFIVKHAAGKHTSSGFGSTWVATADEAPALSPGILPGLTEVVHHCETTALAASGMCCPRYAPPLPEAAAHHKSLSTQQWKPVDAI
jgi:hypothetical protein